MRIGPASPGRSPAPSAPRTAGAGKRFTALLEEGSSVGPTRPATAAAASRTPSPPTAGTAPAPTAGPLRAMLERSVGADRQVDALLEAAARGKTFTPAQLL